MREIKSWFSDFFQFLWAVFNGWAGYATGGAIVALAWLWSTLFPKFPLSRRIGIALALFFLFMAFFNAWRKEHHRRLELEREKRQQEDKATKLLFLSDFYRRGEFLLHVNPAENATQEEIVEWRSKVQKWV